MKTANKIIFILAWLLLLIEAVGAQDTIWIQFDGDSVMVRTEAYQEGIFGGDFGLSLKSYSFPAYDCVRRESDSGWQEDSPGDGKCTHEWVEADFYDVNELSAMTTLLYCPCGCGGSTNYARICEKCGREESRTETYWYDQVPVPDSEYKKLKKQFHGSRN